MALSPVFSTGGLPRSPTRGPGTSVSSVLRTTFPSLKKAGASSKMKLSNVKIPKVSSKKSSFKLSSKTRSGTAVKVSKAGTKGAKFSSLSSALKSILSRAKKVRGMAAPSLARPPAGIPSPAFFGKPNAGPRGFGP